MKQIPTNAPNGIAFALTAHQGGVTAKHLTSGGGYYPTTGIIVIIDEHTNPDKLSQRPLLHADELGFRESACELLLGAGQGVGISGNNGDI